MDWRVLIHLNSKGNGFSPNIETMKQVIIDASSAILLFKAGLFSDLLRSYKIIITESVYGELTGNDHTGAKEFRNYRQSGKMEVQPPPLAWRS